ncbi:TnpV protein, partial [Campylobacter coli]
HNKAKNNNLALSIDVGLKSFLSLSNGLEIKAPKPLAKFNRLMVKRARQLSKKQHAKTKQEALQGIKKSSNYLKASIKLNKLHRKIANIRSDFLHKLTSSLTANVKYFCLEDLNVKGMKQAQGITEQLKAENALEWTGCLNNIRACAREIVEKEIIFA